MTTLFVNACMRGEDSRTLALCREYLQGKEEVVEVDLATLGLKPFDAQMVAYRTEKQKAKAWDDPIFDLSHQFAEADEVVIGAPYWDLSFPAALKVYMEHVSVCDIAFHYTEDARCEGICKADRLTYIASCGGVGGGAGVAAPPEAGRAAGSWRVGTSATSTSAASPRCSAFPRRGSWPPRGWISWVSMWRPRWTRPEPR